MPQDIGFGPVVARKVDDFIGRRSTMTAEGMRADRRQLVGLDVLDAGGKLECGSHVRSPDASALGETQGWVTSSIQSPTLGRPLALALIRQGHSRIGELVQIWDLGRTRPARIVDARFYDAEGARLDA